MLQFWLLRFINVVMNMYKVNIIGYVVIKASECYEHVHGVVCSSLFSISHPWLDWPPSQTVASRNVLISSLHHMMQVKVVMDFRHCAHLYRDNQANVRSQDMVFIPGSNTFLGSYCWHLWSL